MSRESERGPDYFDRLAARDQPPLDDETIDRIAEESFLDYDRDEANVPSPPGRRWAEGPDEGRRVDGSAAAADFGG